MVTEKQKMEMKRRKAIAKASQMVEMLVVYVVFGRQSVFFQRNQKEKK